MSKSREQRVAKGTANSQYRAFEPVVKKVKLTDEYLSRKT